VGSWERLGIQFPYLFGSGNTVLALLIVSLLLVILFICVEINALALLLAMCTLMLCSYHKSQACVEQIFKAVCLLIYV